MSSPIEKKIEALRKEINDYSYSYYTRAKSLISDPEFDRLLKELEELENRYPHLITPDSPTQRIGSDLTDDSKLIKHKFPMLSIKNEDDLNKFDVGIKKYFPKNENVEYIVEPKIDGASVSLEYKNGTLKSASTRGDGTFGEDITDNIKTINSIPQKINIYSLKDYNLADIVVRGEIFIYLKDFERINKEQEEKGGKVFENPRNTAAGILKTKDSTIVAKRPLNSFAYALLDTLNQFKSQEENLKILKVLGFKVNEYYKKCSNINEAISVCNELESNRDSLPYEIDGAVIKVNLIQQQKLLPERTKYPRWAAAYKFDPEKATTSLEGITWQVGRTGIVTPVAELAPIKLAGSTISRASLHNFDFIQEKDIRVGDQVIIAKGGDVIPKVVSVVESNKDNRNSKTKPPKNCPACKSKLVKIKGEVGYYCKNPDCPGKIKNLIQHFVSRNALDIEAIADTVIENLIDKVIIKSPFDLFRLDINTLASLNLGTEEQPRVFGEKNALKALQAIEQARKKSLAKWLFAIGIPKLGEVGAKAIAEKHTDFRNISDSSILKDIVLLTELEDKALLANPRAKVNRDKTEIEKLKLEKLHNKLCGEIEEVGARLEKIGWYKKKTNERKNSLVRLTPDFVMQANKGVGPETAKSVLEFFNSKQGKEVIKNIDSIGINTREIEVKSKILENKIFVITGTLPSMTRPEATELIEKNGGKVTGKVSKITDFLLAGKEPGSKLEEAKKLSVKIISEKQFQQLIAINSQFHEKNAGNNTDSEQLNIFI